jgi:acyl-CoA thioester hydrolase
MPGSDDGDTFHIAVRVYHEDVDTQGVVYHANYLRFMERARTEWLRSLGVEPDQLSAREQILFTIAELTIKYKLPARFNDVLRVGVRIRRLGRVSLNIEQHIERESSELICRAEVKVACVNAQHFRPHPIPSFLLVEIEKA